MTLVILSSLGKAKEAGTESWAVALWLLHTVPVSGRQEQRPEEATGMGMGVGSEVRL